LILFKKNKMKKIMKIIIGDWGLGIGGLGFGGVGRRPHPQTPTHQTPKFFFFKL